jgi:hypothetical protein
MDPATPHHRRRRPPPAPSAEVEQLGDAKYRGLVVIESEPQGANIYIDGKEKGPFAQTPWSGSMDGEFQYLVEKRGYKSKEGRTAADPSKLLVLQIVLSEEDYLGWLEIKSNVPGATIFLDDKNVGAIGKTPFSGNFKPGKHKVWIEADGYETTEHDIEIIAGEAAEITAQLKGSPVGYLYVRGPGIEASRSTSTASCCASAARAASRSRRGATGCRCAARATSRTRRRSRCRPRPRSTSRPSWPSSRAAATRGRLRLHRPVRRRRHLPRPAGPEAREGARGRIAAGNPPVDQNDPRFDRGKYFAIGANAAYGVAGLLGLAAIYYTFRDKGRPSIGVVDVRALTLVPSVGPNYAGLNMETSW